MDLKKIITRFRDAITGRFVTQEYAKENPQTTVKEKRKVYSEPGRPEAKRNK